MTKTSIITNTDSYKVSHFKQYPPGTRFVSSYIESRGGDYDFTLFFGLQPVLAELAKPITAEQIDHAERRLTTMGYEFNRKGWEHILNKHGGKLPISIQAVKEGTVLPTHNVLVQVVNTDPEVPWLTSYVETMLLRGIWYPTTVATRSKYIKNLIKSYLDSTCDTPDAEISFKLHDFGARGVSSRESAAIGGAAHLVNFMGSDTVEALDFIEDNYGEPMAGFSIPAAEHSTITSWGREGEFTAYKNMVDQFAGEGKLYAVVSDSYDIMKAINNIWGGGLKNYVIAKGGRLVVRPDSGDPRVVPVECVEALGATYGFEVNNKGYKVLHPSVRVIQGDGINEKTIAHILYTLQRKGWSAENIAFGMGGELLQTENRDTLKFAMKASAAMVGQEWRDVFKDPITDTGKRSKKGVLALTNMNGEFKTVRASDDPEVAEHNVLETVFRNGEILRYQSFASVRETSNS